MTPNPAADPTAEKEQKRSGATTATAEATLQETAEAEKTDQDRDLETKTETEEGIAEAADLLEGIEEEEIRGQDLLERTSTEGKANLTATDKAGPLGDTREETIHQTGIEGIDLNPMRRIDNGPEVPEARQGTIGDPGTCLKTEGLGTKSMETPKEVHFTTKGRINRPTNEVPN